MLKLVTSHQSVKRGYVEGLNDSLDLVPIGGWYGNRRKAGCEITKSVLIASSYLHLKRNEFVKYASDLTTLCPRILLSGPTGMGVGMINNKRFPCRHFAVQG